MNYRFTIQYDGTRYDGWQRQGNTENTIQGKLEKVLSALAGECVEIQGAGRTDAGVHALAQVASGKLPGEHTPEEILNYVNRYLPEDIAVTAVETAPERFHARLNAKGKEYRYELRLGAVGDVFRRRWQYRVSEDLDLDAMRAAAAALTGQHDFRSFCADRRYRKSTVRTIESIAIERRGADVTLTFRGNGFLPHMVRILTGTLLEVGRGERPATDMNAILSACDRSRAGATAPAQGLTLVKVEY